MFEPIRALLASSFSRNGTRAAAILTNWFGETSISVISSGLAMTNSPLFLAETISVVNLPSLSMDALAWAITWLSSSNAERNLILLVTLPFAASLYGVSIKPNSFTLA